MAVKVTTAAHLIRLSDRQQVTLKERLTTIGSSKRCTIFIDNKKIPPHCAYILFANGSYVLHPVDLKSPIRCNGETVQAPVELSVSSILEFDSTSFLFENRTRPFTSLSMLFTLFSEMSARNRDLKCLLVLHKHYAVMVPDLSSTIQIAATRF
jgi:hypothetical protein